MSHIFVPKIKHTAMIDSHRVEIYWDQEVNHHNIETDYAILKNGKHLAIDTNRTEADNNWASRPIYEPEKKKNNTLSVTKNFVL